MSCVAGVRLEGSVSCVAGIRLERSVSCVGGVRLEGSSVSCSFISRITHS
jgi:hypothetical protein